MIWRALSRLLAASELTPSYGWEMPGWWNWETRQIQGLAVVSTWQAEIEKAVAERGLAEGLRPQAQRGTCLVSTTAYEVEWHGGFVAYRPKCKEGGGCPRT